MAATVAAMPAVIVAGIVSGAVVGAIAGHHGAPPGKGSDLGLAIVGDLLALYGTAPEIAGSPMGGCRMAFSLPGWTDQKRSP